MGEVLTLTRIPVGNQHEYQKVARVRTPAQRRTVEKIVLQPDFDFACSNPFDEEVGDRFGKIGFLYYTKDDRLHYVAIATDGEITRRIDPIHD